MVMPSFVRLKNGVPERQSFVEEKIAEEPIQLDMAEGQVQQVIDTPEGQFTITFTPKEKEAVLDRHSQQAFWQWLSLG